MDVFACYGLQMLLLHFIVLLCLFAQAVQIVGPCLHHAVSMGKILGIVVRDTRGILFLVGQLAFYPVGVKALFIEQG